jgi:hypothetical protein
VITQIGDRERCILPPGEREEGVAGQAGLASSLHEKGGEMASPRLSMDKTREILRQKWSLSRSHREVARSQGVSVGMVGATLRRARRAGLEDWASIERLQETDLETQLYGPARSGSRPVPDPLWIHTERQRKGVTLELLHHEYLEQHPEGYRYTQFCEHYRRWCKKRRLTMRQVHRWVSVASAYVKLEAPKVATNSSTSRSSPVFRFGSMPK